MLITIKKPKYYLLINMIIIGLSLLLFVPIVRGIVSEAAIFLPLSIRDWFLYPFQLWMMGPYLFVSIIYGILYVKLKRQQSNSYKEYLNRVEVFQEEDLTIYQLAAEKGEWEEIIQKIRHQQDDEMEYVLSAKRGQPQVNMKFVKTSSQMTKVLLSKQVNELELILLLTPEENISLQKALRIVQEELGSVDLIFTGSKEQLRLVPVLFHTETEEFKRVILPSWWKNSLVTGLFAFMLGFAIYGLIIVCSWIF